MLVVLLIVLHQSSSACALEPPAKQQLDWVYLHNTHLRLGLLRSHGGAIGYLSKASTDDNLLDHYDHGRLVQQSYYGDRDGSLWDKKPWRYNPVQGGSWQSVPAKVVEFQSNSTTAYAKTIPRHWANGDLLKECTMEQWVELQGPLVAIRYRFTYQGKQLHKARHQETPAMFVAARLETLVTYSGSKPWQNDSLEQTVPGWPNQSAILNEHWAAYIDENNQGVGIYVPGVTKATCYRYTGHGNSDCSYVAPLRTFALKPDLDFSYQAYLTLGDLQTIRQRFYELHKQQK